MIEYETGDMLLADVQALVNTVNCVGVMGKGIALQFKQTFPENFREYKKVCDRGGLEPGRLLVYDRGELFEEEQEPQYVINFPTKTHWRKPSKLEYIEQGIEALVEQGIEALVEEVQQRDIESIAIPPSGVETAGWIGKRSKPSLSNTWTRCPMCGSSSIRRDTSPTCMRSRSKQIAPT